MEKYVRDYTKRVALLMVERHGVRVDVDLVDKIIKFFLNNIVISLYNQIPVVINKFFKIYIYPNKIF